MDSIDILRYVASVGLTIAGAVSLIVQFRKPTDRRLTPAGALMLLAIIGTGVLLVSLQVVDSHRERERRRVELAAREADQRRLRDVQQQLVRASLPLDMIQVGYWFHITERTVAPEVSQGLVLLKPGTVAPNLFGFGPPYHPDLPSYFRRLQATLTPDRLRDMGNYTRLGISAAGTSDLVICEKSRLFPDPRKEPSLFRTIRRASLEIRIYKPPISVSQNHWSTYGPDKPRPDIQFRLNGPVPTDSPHCPLCGCVWIERDFRRLSVATRFEVMAREFVTTGKVTSVLDLAGAQIFVRAVPVVRDIDRLQPTIRQFSLKPGTSPEIFLPLKKYSTYGSAVYEYTFPARVEDFEALRNHGTFVE